ncbi:MAG: hypothetical protein ACRDLD_02455 [Thermoleophilaceae bacterium]
MPLPDPYIPDPATERNFREIDQRLTTTETDQTAIDQRLTVFETPEAWHVIGVLPNPVFENGWVAFEATARLPAFYKDPFETVHLKGLAKNGVVGQPAFTLPLGYRIVGSSSFGALFLVNSNGGLGDLRIFDSGAVTLNTGSNAYFSLYGISFRAEA